VVTIGLNPDSYSVAEDAGSVSVTVSALSGALERGVFVVLVTSVNDGTATGGNLFVCFILLKCIKPFLITPATLDYSFISSELMFSTTASSQVVTIPILNDTILESSETVNVTVTSIDPAAILNPASAVITIEDNDGK